MFTEKEKIEFWSKVNIKSENDCWEWKLSLFKNGYGQVTIKQKKYYAHRVAYIIAHGEITKPVIMHSCDNPICCNPNHLSQGTQKENLSGAIERNRIKKGKDNPCFGRVQSEEERRKKSLSTIGKSKSLETRKRMSEAQYKMWAEVKRTKNNTYEKGRFICA